jgi:hypothetical protein
MNTIIMKERNNIIWCKIFLLLLLIIMTAFAASAQVIIPSTQIIPDARRVTWQGNVGVSGDIPARTNIYTTLSPSGGNDSIQIQNTINSCPSGQVVKLNAGTFLLDSIITIPSGVTLRGNGMGSTVLRGRSASGSYLVTFKIAGYQWDLTNQPSRNITGGFTKGSTQVSTSAAHGWTVGDIILIDQINNPSGNPPSNGGTEGCSGCGRPFSGSNTRWVGQVNKVIGIPNSTTATLELPLYFDYSINYTPQGTKMSGLSANSGIEDLTVDNSNTGCTSVIEMEGAQNCWLLRVETIGSQMNSIMLFSTYRNTIRSCKIHEGVPATPSWSSYNYGSSRAYGIVVHIYGSANLIEDNIIYHTSTGITFKEGCVTGNVFAYNYITGLIYTSYAGQTQDNASLREAIVGHGAWPVMNLIEGNQVDGNIGQDDYHGPGAWNTIFRNYVPSVAGKTMYVWSVPLASSCWYWNVVGNVFGSNGIPNTYETSQVTLPSSTKAVYVLSYMGTSDANVKATLLRHGNWDTATPGIRWDPSIDDHNLPDSLYLASKPSWYGGCTWPPVDPNGPVVEDIPAKLRYEGSSCTTDTNRPSAPQGLQFK